VGKQDRRRPSLTVDWRNLFSVRWDGGLQIQASWLVFVLVAAVAAFSVFRIVRHFRSTFVPVEIDVPIAGYGSIKLRRTDEVVRIAHEAWTEIITRKAGLEFDPENDLVVEVYDSWYELFGQLRSLTRSVPGETLRTSKDARQLVDVLVDVLNKGLRPHLTVHQARFRRWLESRADADDDRDPQEVERSYPRYEELVADLNRVHTEVVRFASQLHALAHGTKDTRPPTPTSAETKP
jgi:phosphate/sulfate permease